VYVSGINVGRLLRFQGKSCLLGHTLVQFQFVDSRRGYKAPIFAYRTANPSRLRIKSLMHNARWGCAYMISHS
jgi:hypothetical protein